MMSITPIFDKHHLSVTYTEIISCHKRHTYLLLIFKISNMNCTKIFAAAILSTGLFLVTACGSEGSKRDEKIIVTDEQPAVQPEVHGTEVKPSDVTLSTPLNVEWVASGKSIYELKCQSCHKLTDERIVGPGWAGVTKRREPHWVMNMITNVEMMLETDAEAQ